MPITAPEPVVIPEIPEKTFQDQWIYNLLIHAPSIASGRIAIEFLPFNGSTGEIGPSEHLQRLDVPDFFACVAAVPEAYEAYQAVLAAIEPIRIWQAEQAEQEENLD